MDASHCSSIPPTSNSTELTQLNELILHDGKYEGELKNNLRHGLGIFIWDNGDAYFGSWVDDRMHGKGIFCYNTGHYVEGTFAYDFLEGPACITYPDKSFTKGIFKRGELNGRVLSYQKENHSWALQDYERGKLKGVCYEGKGMPLTYDFSLNTYGQDFGGFEKKNDNIDINYAIKSIKRDQAAAYSVGCFELEYGMRHYGIIKNNRIEGLGIRFIIKGIEVGKYREDRLDGAARKLEFGRELYEGEFLQGRYYGHGKLWEWKKRDNLMIITTGILTSGIIMQKIKEERASLEILNETLRYDANEAKVIRMSIRDYRDTFAKDYAEIDSRNDDSKTIETTIKEIAYAKILSRETVIECQEVQKGSIPEPLTPESIQNSPSRRALMETSSHLAKMVNALNNDPYDVTTTLQATQGYIDRLKKRLDDQERSRNVQSKPPKRSQSSERERDMEPSFSQVFTIGIDDKPSTVRTHRSVSRDTARYGQITINYPFSQVIVGNQVQENDSYRNHRNVGLENKSKPMTVNIDAKYNFGSESILNTTRHHTETDPRTAYTIQDSDRKLTKMQKSSRSSTNLHTKTVETNHDESSEKVVKTLAFSGVREPSPVRKVPLVISTKRLSSETFSQKTAASASKLSGERAPVRFGSSRNLNTEGTPKKGNSMQTSMNRANSSSHLSSKKASTVTKGKTPLPKNPITKDRYGIAGPALKTLPSESSFLGNSPIVKKATPASAVLPKSRDSSRINKQTAEPHSKSYLNQDTRRCHTTVETYDITARKSARPTARGNSPAQVVELDLQCYSTTAKTGNDRKETRCDTSEKSVASTNIWSAQKASYLKEEPSYTAPDDTAYQGSVQRTMPTERNSANKQSARSKSPLLSNIVSIDISMFKAGEGDGQKQGSPVRLQTIQDNSPISYMDTKSSFISNGFEQYINHIVDGSRSGENTAFTFMPAKDILGTFAKKREEKAFGKAGPYGIEDDGEIETKREISVRNNLAPLVHYDLQSNNVGHSFERKNEMMDGDKEYKQNHDGEEISKSKATPGHNVNTPSFSQKNFKFTITDNIKLNYDTPKKGGRYEALDLKSQQNIIETLNSPPYKSSAQKQLDFVVKSSGKGKISAPESPVKNKITENDSVDSFSGYYPVKKTCGLQSDSYRSESLGSIRGSPQKSTSQKGSPTKQIRPVFTNQSDIISPKTSQCQVMMTESNNDNIKIIGEDANQYPETLSIGFSSNRGDTPSRLVKGLKEESECKLDLQALPTLSSKYENLKESERMPLTGSSSGKPADVSPERKDKSQSSQASSKATSTAYFGFRSGPATPQIDFDISSNYPIVKQHPVEEAVHNNEQADYFSLRPAQQDNFINKIGVKRPKLVVEPTLAMNNGGYSVSTSDYRRKIGEVEHYMNQSPYKGEASNRATEQDKSMISAISSIQEEWGTTKDVNNLSNFHFGAEDYNTRISKFAMAPHGQLSQIYKLPEETRTTLSYKAQPSVRVFQSKNDGRGHEQVFGNAVAMNGLYNPGIDLRPPVSGNRYKSANKSHRNGDVSRGGDNDLSVSFVEEEARSRRVNQSSGNKVVYDRYNIADEDDISEEKTENLRYDLMSRRKMETKRASAENDFSGTSAKRMK